MDAKNYITCGGVGVSGSSLWQIERNRKVFEVKREGLKTCELHFGSPEERPLVSAALGAILMIPGGWLISVFLFNRVHIGLGGLRYDLAMILFFGLGLWLIYQAVGRRAYYLKVTKDGVGRKLVFGVRSGSEIYVFLEEAKSRFGFTYANRSPAARVFTEPNQSSEPTPASDTSPAGQEPRLP